MESPAFSIFATTITTSTPMPRSDVLPKRTFPPILKMVKEAIIELNENRGSSLHAIKKYIASKYNNYDVKKKAGFIKKAIKSGLVKNELVQSSGTGLGGKFRLASVTKKNAKKVKKPKKASATVKKPLKAIVEETEIVEEESNDLEQGSSDAVKTSKKMAVKKTAKPKKINVLLNSSILPKKNRTKKAKTTTTPKAGVSKPKIEKSKADETKEINNNEVIDDERPSTSKGKGKRANKKTTEGVPQNYNKAV